jgi:hypothetical protein
VQVWLTHLNREKAPSRAHRRRDKCVKIMMIKSERKRSLGKPRRIEGIILKWVKINKL